MANPIDFIRDFLNYVEKQGIYDEFDATSQKMITSKGVEALIVDAQSYLPEKLKPLAAAARMRDLNDHEREKLIADSEEGKIIDMRKHFQEKMSRNNGAQGIIAELVSALDTQDELALKQALFDAQKLVHGPENVTENS